MPAAAALAGGGGGGGAAGGAGTAVSGGLTCWAQLASAIRTQSIGATDALIDRKFMIRCPLIGAA